MTSKKFTKVATRAAITLAAAFSFVASAQNVRADVEANSIMGCHDAVFYNNSNKGYNIVYDYEYSGTDGSRFSNRQSIYAPPGQKTTQFMNSHTVDCRKTRYTVRITNWQAR